jgi:hypothetical protein
MNTGGETEPRWLAGSYPWWMARVLNPWRLLLPLVILVPPVDPVPDGARCAPRSHAADIRRRRDAALRIANCKEETGRSDGPRATRIPPAKTARERSMIPGPMSSIQDAS